MAKITLNQAALNRIAQDAFQDACYRLHSEIVKVISEAGAFDGFEGDIVDTGNLRASQQPPTINGNEATFRNTAGYALYVYMGFTYSNGREVKGRPWMELAQERLDFQKTFEILLRAKLK